MSRDKNLTKLDKAYIVTSAPGDATRYTFIVAEIEPRDGVRRLCFCPYDDGASVNKTHVVEDSALSRKIFGLIDLKARPRENLFRIDAETEKNTFSKTWAESHICRDENPYTMLEVYRIAKLIFSGRESELSEC